MRRMKVPPRARANRALNSAVRAPHTCRKPVGLGAKRTRTCMARISLVAVAEREKSGAAHTRCAARCGLAQHGDLARLGRAPQAQAQEVDPVLDRGPVLVAQVPGGAEASRPGGAALQRLDAPPGDVVHGQLEV